MRTSRYLYTEWETDRPLPEIELYDTYSDPAQLDNVAEDPSYAGVVADLRGQLDELLECQGANCREQPSGQLELSSGGNGQAGCSFPPYGARFTSASAGSIDSVEFRVGNASVATDTAAPFEAAIPESAVRDALPREATVVALASFADGRRLALPAKIKACK